MGPVSVLVFCADITMHLSVFTEKVHHSDIFVHNVSDCVKSFECKLEMWKDQLKNYNLTHL